MSMCDQCGLTPCGCAPRVPRERQPKVQCPHCGHWFSKVVGHGDILTTGAFKRYRRCESCKQRYSATERADPVAPRTTAVLQQHTS